MTDLVRFGNGSLLPSRVERQTNRALQGIRSNQILAAAHEVAKIEVLAETGEAGLLAISHVSAVEALLVARTPHAEARLKHCADFAALGITNVVMKAGRRLS